MAGFEGKNFKIVGAATSIGQPKNGVDKTSDVLKAEKIENLIHPNRCEWIDIVYEAPYEHEPIRTKPIRNVEGVGRYLKSLYDTITTRVTRSDFLITIGGDHTIASATISAVSQVYGSDLGIIWIDAHGDCNTPETSPSGNFHGMPIAHLINLITDPSLEWGQPKLSVQQFALIGIRDLDPLEVDLVNSIGLVYYTMEQVNELGIDHCIKSALKHVDPDNNKKIHFSVDVDGLDPTLFPGTGTAVEFGLTFEHYSVIVQHLKELGERFVSMDVVEINYEIEKEKTLESTKELMRITFS